MNADALIQKKLAEVEQLREAQTKVEQAKQQEQLLANELDDKKQKQKALHAVLEQKKQIIQQQLIKVLDRTEIDSLSVDIEAKIKQLNRLEQERNAILATLINDYHHELRKSGWRPEDKNSEQAYRTEYQRKIANDLGLSLTLVRQYLMF